MIAMTKGDTPRTGRTLAELMGQGDTTRTICPECRRDGFYTGKPWRRKDGGESTFRTRLCRWCGHAHTEKVTVVIEIES